MRIVGRESYFEKDRGVCPLKEMKISNPRPSAGICGIMCGTEKQPEARVRSRVTQFCSSTRKETMNLKKMNKGLDFLREKYGAAKGEITIKDGHCYVGATPLLPGRMERKIVELNKMTENGTLEGVSTLRFASFAPGGGRGATALPAMLAKELDLAAYLGASDVTRVMAVASGNAINVLAKLANDVNVSVEVGAGLPKAATSAALPYDRHEIIAKRGVACDQTVDTHTPHASIRVSNAKGMEEFTDVDTELFGLTYEEIWNVRAAFALLQGRASAKVWKAAWAKATKAAALAFAADKSKAAKTIAVKKGLDTNQSIKVSEVR